MASLGWVLSLIAGASEPRRPPPLSRWEVETCWFGLSLDVAIGRKAPLTFGLHVADVAMASAGKRFQLDVPVFGVGWDYYRPSSVARKGSVSLSFVQSPLLFFLAGSVLEGTDSRPLEALVGTLLWLSGGTFHWTPGGNGNLHHSRDATTTLSVVAKNEFAVHPFVGPAYLRDTPALALSIRGDGAHPLTGTVVPDYACSIGAFASVGQELGGRRSFDRGVWVSCALGYIPVY